MSQQVDGTTGEIVEAPTKHFDPRPFLRDLNGKKYLEVVRRLQWIRAEYPSAIVTTQLLQLDFERGWVVFHARVEIPGQGVAEGTGSETRENFPAGWFEKAETIAVGRALAALGYGTAFCLDFETIDEAGRGHMADAPVDHPRNGQAAPPPQSSGNLATPAQLKLIYLTAEKGLHITGEELEERCEAQYGRAPLHLTKREASEFIDSLKSGQVPPTAQHGPAPAPQQPAPQPTGQEDVQVWVNRWLEQVGAQDTPKLGKRSEELKWMTAHLEGAMPPAKVPLLCKTLHEAFTGDTLAEGVLVGEVMDGRLILALKGADNAALMMLSRFAKGL